MGERADQIEARIHETRANLSDNIDELEDKVKGVFDWRRQFEERPMTMLAVAFGAGVVGSALLPSRRLEPKRYAKRVRSSFRNRANRAAEESADAVDEATERTGDAFDAMKGALMTVAASKLGGVIGDLLAGYREQVRKAKQKYM